MFQRILDYMRDSNSEDKDEKLIDKNKNKLSVNTQQKIYVKPSRVLKIIRNRVKFSSPENIQALNGKNVKISIKIGKSTYKVKLKFI